MATVDFIYGLGSRYSYLASTQVGRIARETGARFRWQPISTHALLARRADDPFTPGALGQYDWDYRRRDAEAWARHYGVAFNDPIGRLGYEPMLPALAALAACRQGRTEAMSHRLFRLVFVDDRTTFGPREVAAEAASLGLDLARSGRTWTPRSSYKSTSGASWKRNRAASSGCRRSSIATSSTGAMTGWSFSRPP